jgi:predicted hydrocarbon binding protein
MLALKVMPVNLQVKLGLDNMQGGFRRLWHTFGQTLELKLEDRGDKIAYIAVNCPICAGQQADGLVCFVFTGMLQEAMRWLTGKEHQVQEVECRATGADRCVWEVHKQPLK